MSCNVVAKLSCVVQRGQNSFECLALVGRRQTGDVLRQEKQRINAIDVTNTIGKESSEVPFQPLGFSYQGKVIARETVKKAVSLRKSINIKLTNIGEKERSIRFFQNIGFIGSHCIGVVISRPNVVKAVFLRVCSIQRNSDSSWA